MNTNFYFFQHTSTIIFILIQTGRSQTLIKIILDNGNIYSDNKMNGEKEGLYLLADSHVQTYTHVLPMLLNLI
jgi:hypothetical protein